MLYVTLTRCWKGGLVMGGRGGYLGGSSSGTGDSSIGFKKTYESDNGGTVYTEKSRIEQSNINKQEKAKYEKEHDMCKHLADNGHDIVHLDDRNLSEGSYDILLDGEKAELKSMKGTTNIGREGKDAIRKQKADFVVFKFEGFSAKTNREIEKLVKNNIHGCYYVEGQKGLEWF